MRTAVAAARWYLGAGSPGAAAVEAERAGRLAAGAPCPFEEGGEPDLCVAFARGTGNPIDTAPPPPPVTASRWRGATHAAHSAERDG
jgi:hypothetical protein